MFHDRFFYNLFYHCLSFMTVSFTTYFITAYVSLPFFYDLYVSMLMLHNRSFTTYMSHCLCFTTVLLRPICITAYVSRPFLFTTYCITAEVSRPLLLRPIVSLLMFHDRFLYDLLYHYILMFHDRCFITSCFMTYTVSIVDLLLVLIFHDCEEEEKFIKVSVSRNLLPFLHVSGPKRPLINR